MEKEDIPVYLEWLNNPEVMGEYQLPTQWSRTELEKTLETSPFEPKVFIIEKKDGSKIGFITKYDSYLGLGKLLEIGYALALGERGKGYCTEATQLMIDYLFLSMDVSRIQATTSI